MTDEFRFKSPSMRNYRNWLKKLGPKQFKFAMAGYLNFLAFEMKKEHMPDTLTDNMNIRDPKFMHRQLRVNKARPSDGARMKSEAGSAAIGKFRGWEEQQEGKASKNRVHTLMSQVGGTEKGKIRGPQRLKKGTVLDTPAKHAGKYHKTFGQRTVAMIMEARKTKSKKMFKISRGGGPGRLQNFKAGVYQYSRKFKGKIARIWNFEKPQTTKKIKWLDKSVVDLNRRAEPKKIWKAQVKRQIKFRK